MMRDGKWALVSNHLADIVIFPITIWKASKWKLYFVTERRQMILCFGFSTFVLFEDLAPALWPPGLLWNIDARPKLNLLVITVAAPHHRNNLSCYSWEAASLNEK